MFFFIYMFYYGIAEAPNYIKYIYFFIYNIVVLCAIIIINLLTEEPV